MEKYDAVVIGGGVTGCLTLMRLSRYRLRLLLVEAGGDLASGATRANSAVIHAGFDPVPGTLKARLNVRGSRLYPELARMLDIPYKPLPSLVAAYTQEQLETVSDLLARGRENGCERLSLLSRGELLAAEPHITPNALGALKADSSAIIEPWTVAIAAGECACDNGAEVRVNCRCEGISRTDSGFELLLRTPEGCSAVSASVVVNAAGVCADDVHALLAPPRYRITGKRGNYFVLDRGADGLVNNILFPCPTKKGKGILILPEIHGRIMLGPDSELITDKTSTATSWQGLSAIREAVAQVLNVRIPFNTQVRTFCGVRPVPDTGDFIIEESLPGFIDAAGIESPGLASAPAVSEEVCALALNALGGAAPKDNTSFSRRPRLTTEEAMRRGLPGANELVCRCDKVSEAVILDAIRRNCGARTVSGVKYRTTAGAGGCQGGFCQPKVVEILARELGISRTDVLLDRPGSNILTDKTREG